MGDPLRDEQLTALAREVARELPGVYTEFVLYNAAR